jgi:hypothetical protein
MKPTNRTLRTSAGYGTGEYVERVIHIGDDGNEYVEQDGEWISVEGAKKFRTPWPVHEQVRNAVDQWKERVSAFPDMSKEEQQDALADLLDDVFKYAQTKELHGED